MQRLSIIGMMRLVIFCAVGLTALRNATELWAGTMLTLVLGMLGIALLAILYQRGKDRAWWVGFALFSGAYLTLSFGPWFSTAVQPRLVTTQLLDYIHFQVNSFGSVPPARPIEYLVAAARFFNTAQFEIADKYLDAANRYRDRLLADEAAMLDAYIAESARVKGKPVVLPPAAVGPNHWQVLLPGAANHDQFLMVGHAIFAVLTGLAGAMIASRFRARRERSEDANT
jgi:hypothetical protein